MLVAGVLLSGCGSTTVQVDDFDVTSAGKERCAALLADLPERVGDQPSVRVAGSSYAAAWGEDDRIVLRCGVQMPAEFDQTSECNLTNGIGWYVPSDEADDQSADLTMTTVHRSPALSVEVPAALRPPAAVMVDLAEVIRTRTTATGSCR